jgi:putative transposase
LETLFPQCGCRQSSTPRTGSPPRSHSWAEEYLQCSGEATGPRFTLVPKITLVPKLHLGTQHLPSKLCFGTLADMRSRYRVHERDQAHFVTSTVVGWLPVFTTAARCDIVVGSLRYCQTNKALKVYAWVILDNHFHAIVAAPDLTRVMADLKRHSARRLIEQLESEGCDWLLEQLRRLRHPRKLESAHQFWQEGFHPQAMVTDEIMLQKLEYLHNNPVKRGLVASPEHWRYSSAHEWLAGADLGLRVDQWR